MRRVRCVGAWAVPLLPLLLGLAGCAGSSASPVADTRGFHVAANDARVYDVYRQTHAHLQRAIRAPAGSRHVRVRMDCIGHGEIHVKVFGGEAAVPCGDRSSPDGFIGWSKPPGVSQNRLTDLRVTTPRGSTWSLALDFGPGKIDTSIGD